MLDHFWGSKNAIFAPPQKWRFRARRKCENWVWPEFAPAPWESPRPGSRGRSNPGQNQKIHFSGVKKLVQNISWNLAKHLPGNRVFWPNGRVCVFRAKFDTPNLYGMKTSILGGGSKKHVLGKSVHPPICISITSGKKNTVCQVHFFVETFHTDFETRRPAFGKKVSSF